MLHVPQGAGGWLLVGNGASKNGHGGGYSDAANSLRSDQTLRLLFLVSEGVTGGLKAGCEIDFFDDVPVQNPDRSRNFEGFAVIHLAFRVRLDRKPHAPVFLCGCQDRSRLRA